MQPQTSTVSSLDNDAVNLAKAIRQTESGGNFQAQGKSGEYGGYQFTEPTWNAYSKKHGVNAPLRQATPEQQNEVAYKQIKEWKDSGYNVGQIASMWNSGKPDAYLDTNYKGVNKKGVNYDVPAYAKSVATAYQTIKNGGQVNQDPQNPSSTGGYNPKPFSSGENPFMINTSGQTEAPKPQEEGLGSKLMGRANDASTAIQDTMSGKINPLSGVLQTVGAGAGAVNDTVQKGLELIPGVKSVEKLIGKGVGKLAQTDVGQKVVGGVQDFSQKHPELSADIGAAGNIVGAYGTISGINSVKKAVQGGFEKAFGNQISNSAKEEIVTAASKTIGGRKALEAAGEDGLKVLQAKEFSPVIEGGRFSTQAASENIENAISKIDNEMLQPLLESANPGAVSERMPLSSLRDAAVNEAKDALIDESGINKLFDRITSKYGDYVTLPQINEAKRLVAKQISESAFGSETYTTNKIVRSALQEGVEKGAELMGLGDAVNPINAEMRAFFKALKVLEKIEGKTAKGLIGKFARNHPFITAGAKNAVKFGVLPAVGLEGAHRLLGD